MTGINLKSLQQRLNKIFAGQPIVFAYIFGSYAKKKAGPLSDLDIAVFLNKRISLKNRDKIRFDIKDEIETALRMPDKVDIVVLNEAPPLLEREVVYGGKLIYIKDDGVRAHYEAGAIGRWLDWKFYEEQFLLAIKKQFGQPINACS